MVQSIGIFIKPNVPLFVPFNCAYNKKHDMQVFRKEAIVLTPLYLVISHFMIECILCTDTKFYIA